jgi:hypothetical protein
VVTCGSLREMAFFALFYKKRERKFGCIVVTLLTMR